jgi:hypothetical protein
MKVIVTDDKRWDLYPVWGRVNMRCLNEYCSLPSMASQHKHIHVQKKDGQKPVKIITKRIILVSKLTQTVSREEIGNDLS